MYDTLKKSQYKVVSIGALPSVPRNVKPTDSGIAALYTEECKSNRKQGTGREVTTKKTKIG